MTDTVVVTISPESLGLTPYQLDNLETLQRFLTDEAVPPPKFAMGSYLSPGSGAMLGGSMAYDYVPVTESQMAVYNECGTSACAIGHGPLAGIPAIEGEWWNDYAKRVFGVCGVTDDYTSATYGAWEFMFGGEWGGNENTAIAAAARIRWFLSGQLTSDHRKAYRRRYHPEPKPWLAGLIFEA